LFEKPTVGGLSEEVGLIEPERRTARPKIKAVSRELYRSKPQQSA
jgi:hypothetical protein